MSGLAPAPRVDVLGVHVSAVNMRSALEHLTSWIGGEHPRYVCVTGVHGVMESSRDPSLRDIHNASGMTTPDGMPMVWAGRRAGASWMERVYGPDLMLEVCERGVEHGWRHYLYGGKQGVPELLATRLSERFVGLRVVGTCSPPFREMTPDEDAQLIEEMRAARPDFVWVGLSTPKQERWMAAHADRIAATLVGVGAAFDIHAGLLPQAPPWMQQRGLEWLYRLAREPRRLWRRYLSNNPRFVLGILRRPPVLLGGATGPAAR